MKKTLLIALAALPAFPIFAQMPFNTRDSVNINKVNAMVLVHGDMWWDPVAQVAKCEFPQGSHKHVGFMSSVWMSGYDGGGQLHTAAQTYRQNGNDYWPGPLDNNDTLTYTTSSNWAKIWKVYRSDIQYFQSLSSHSVANTPPGILTWPAAGNVNAAGNGGAALSISATANMAPFVDVNGNGIYEPLLGDYPDVKGDEALWWVFSDNGPTHTETHGKPLGVEVHVMSYAYSRGTLLDNIVYYEYTIVNKSAYSYNNFRLAQFSDADLGYYGDDFIGFDSSHRMGVLYNGTADDGAGVGHPQNSYGLHAPVSGVSIIVMPGDVGSGHIAAGSFDYYNNDGSVIGNPIADTEYNYYIRSRIRNGVHFTNDFMGPGIPSSGFGTGPATNYVFTGDPSDTSKWSECAAGNIPGDRRFIISSNDFTLAAGTTQKLVMALVVTDTNQGGCPAVGFHDIKVVADTAWTVYSNPPPPIPAAISSVNAGEAAIYVYPNPADSRLNIDIPSGMAKDAAITIYNAVGQVMNVELGNTTRGAEANISLLPKGVYYLLYQATDARQAICFIKE